MGRTHGLTVRADVDGHLWIECSVGDLSQHLGAEPTPDEIARAADAHWGSLVRRFD